MSAALAPARIWTGSSSARWTMPTALPCLSTPAIAASIRLPARYQIGRECSLGRADFWWNHPLLSDAGVGTSARIAPESLPRFAAPAAASTPQEGPMSTAIVDTAASRHWRRLLSFLGREFREILPPTLFFFVGFNLILLTKRLVREDYLIQYAGFLVATTSALLVGKSVLVANTMPFL